VFPLPIFPEGGLASSVITTVWVGVFVLCFFNLRFGWVLSGLVVPGYLVPLLIVKPLAAAVIVVEAILTYGIVWLFSEKLSRGRFPSLFGRDRFMGLILASIAVRLGMDGWILPQIADWLATNYNQRLDWQSDLQSFGLVIISLLANQFWKPGLVRGLFAAFVVTAISFVIIRYGLMEFTNFRMSGVSYLYEGLASSVLASPKAYMILVLTALYASHMNVKYGWDFSGILIPALIALQWYQPTKIVTSFVEAAAIYFIARQLLKTPWLANVTVEGANKILLFFNISFVLKLIVGHLLVWLAWDVKTTDFYGFGYLLSTLLAITAHDKDIFPRLMRSTLQVSFVGAVFGNLAGIASAAILPATTANAAPGTRIRSANAVDDLVVRAIGDSGLRRATFADGSLDADRRDALRQAIELLESGLSPLQAGAGASAGGWTLTALDERRVALARADGVGADLLLFDGDAPNDLAVTVPDGSVPGIGLAALELSERLGARWLVLTSPQPRRGGEDDTVLTVFREARSGAAIELRPSSAGTTRLSLADRSATALNMQQLRAALPDLTVNFSPLRSGRRPVIGAPGVLTLADDDIARLVQIDDPDGDIIAQCSELTSPSKERRPRSTVRNVYLRDQIVRPLLEARPGSPQYQIARRAAQVAGFSLSQCMDGDRRLTGLIGSQAEGRYLFDPAGRRDRIVIAALRADGIGRPAVRSSGDTLERSGYAVADAARARLLALAPRELSYDGAQDTVFGVVTQTTIDTLRNNPALVLQLRTRPRIESAVSPDRAVISTDRIGSGGTVGNVALDIVRAAGLSPVLADRDRQSAGFEAFSQTALMYLQHSQNKRYAVIFVPEGDRQQ